MGTFRHSAGFGKRIEYWVVGLMLKDGLDVYLPLVDDDAIDAVVKKADGSFVGVQIKARSKTVKLGDGFLKEFANVIVKAVAIGDAHSKYKHHEVASVLAVLRSAR